MKVEGKARAGMDSGQRAGPWLEARAEQKRGTKLASTLSARREGSRLNDIVQPGRLGQTARNSGNNGLRFGRHLTGTGESGILVAVPINPPSEFARVRNAILGSTGSYRSEPGKAGYRARRGASILTHAFASRCVALSYRNFRPLKKRL